MEAKVCFLKAAVAYQAVAVSGTCTREPAPWIQPVIAGVSALVTAIVSALLTA